MEQRNEEIRAAVAGGMSLKDAADRWGITRQRIHQITRDIVIGRGRHRHNDDAIIELALSGIEPATIATKLKLSITAVRAILRRHGVKPVNTVFVDILKRLDAGESPPDVAVAVGMSLSNIRRIQQRKSDNGRVMTAPRVRRVSERDTQIWNDYSAGATITSLGDRYGLSLPRIYQILSYERSKVIARLLAEHSKETA
jgi:Mor family transcriptional regulator